jgi:hypothetical protein
MIGIKMHTGRQHGKSGGLSCSKAGGCKLGLRSVASLAKHFQLSRTFSSCGLLFGRSERISDFGTVVLLFVCDKYYLIMD